MKKIKLCCFTVNSTHSYIIANNFIDSELENVKVIYINEKSEKSERRKIKNITDKNGMATDKQVLYHFLYFIIILHNYW